MNKIDLDNKTILVTGCAGFIGYNLVKRLCSENIKVVGIDNISNYYDIKLKEHRLDLLKEYNNFTFLKEDINDKKRVNEIFNKYKPDIVVNLAAQAGARDSINNPDLYIETNIIGFYNILEACREIGVEHLVFASSSSVYGENNDVPFKIDDNTDTPKSLYAATKKSNEVIAYAYSKIFDIPITGLRFFTVYGPLGRPDMAYYSFTDKLISKETIKINNYGNCMRDFTYIDDIIESMVRVMKIPKEKELGNDNLPVAPYKIYNIGNSNPVKLLDFIIILTEELKRVELLPKDYDFNKYSELVSMQPGDVEITYADTKELEKDIKFKPNTDLREGLRNFVEWYKEYYKK